MLALLIPLSAQAGGGDSPQKVIAQAQRREGKLKVGDVAPDAAVVQRDGASSTLLAAKKVGRPLVVVFGSFT